MKLLIGTYTSGESQGVYTYDFNPTTGETHYVDHITVDNPSFMDIQGDILYVLSENDASSAAVHSFDLNTLEPIQSQSVASDYPCHLIANEYYVATANYGGGAISVFQTDQAGDLRPQSQTIDANAVHGTPSSHLHCLIPSPEGKYLFATDLGKDSIYRFEVDAQKSAVLTPLYPSVALTKGSGPRHLTFSESGQFAYLINELSGTVVVFQYKDGNLAPIQEILSDHAGGHGSADIHISPDGDFLYASNRLKGDGISIFRITPETGLLTYISGIQTGIHPRNFCITPDGAFLLVACRDSDAVQLYQRDMQDGFLHYMGEAFDIKLDQPVFVAFFDTFPS